MDVGEAGRVCVVCTACRRDAQARECNHWASDFLVRRQRQGDQKIRMVPKLYFVRDVSNLTRTL